MMKKLYFVVTNGYNMIVSDDGETRRIISNEYIPQGSITPEEAERFLIDSIEDDSSWEEFAESVEELTKDCDIIEKIEKEL